MEMLVGNEAGTAFEGSQSLGVLLQPLCSVDALVSVEMRSAFKALCTLRTTHAHRHTEHPHTAASPKEMASKSCRQEEQKRNVGMLRELLWEARKGHLKLLG